MKRITLSIVWIMAMAVAASASTTHVQAAVASASGPGNPSPRVTLSDRIDAAPETIGQATQPAKTSIDVSGSTRAFTTQDWLNELDGRIARQEGTLRIVLTRIQYFVGALMLLVGGTIAYLWVRLAQLAAECNRLQASLESSVDLQSEEMIPQNATAPQPVLKRRASQDAARPAMTSGVPRVRVLAGVIDHLAIGINQSRQRRGDVETGYALMGKITGDGDSRAITVCSLIDEGPNSARSGGHHKADRVYQQRELDLLQLVDGDLMHIGDAHLHPGDMDTCSGGDYRTDQGNVRASKSQEMVFVIATAISAHRAGRSANSIYHDGLKLDFFYMGRSSGYEYRHFRPEVVQGAALTVPLGLRRFAAADPVRAKLDFDNLRRLTAYRMAVGKLPTEGGAGRACIEMSHKARGFKTIIAFSGDPHARPEVFVDTGSQMMLFQPAWLDGGWTPGLVWFTPIVLDAERELIGRRVVGTEKQINAPADGRSAPAVAKCIGPTNGESHGKLPAVEQGAGRGNPAGNGQHSDHQ